MFDSDDSDRDQRGNFTRRGLLLGAGQLALFGGLGARFYQLQVMERARYAPLADQNRMDVQIIPAVRGRILDRGGLLLADNEEAFRVTLTPALCADIKGVLRRLSRILPISLERREQLLVRARRQSRNTPLVIASEITFEQLAEINVLTPQLSGVRTEIAWRRHYTEGETMGHIVGYVGSVDRSVLDADDDAVLRVPGMKVGKAGVELALEPELARQGRRRKGGGRCTRPHRPQSHPCRPGPRPRRAAHNRRAAATEGARTPG